MSLTLRVISQHAGAMGGGAVREFSDGGVIGRAAGSDWKLVDPEKYVSSAHCRIDCQNGVYVLTDTSTNGTFVNDLTRPVDRGAPVRLNEGDRIYVGEYEIAVHVTQGAANTTSPPSMPGYAADLASQTGPVTGPVGNRFGNMPPNPNPYEMDSSELDPFGSTRELVDPLAALDNATGQKTGPVSNWTQPSAPMSDHGPVLEDHMDIPSRAKAPIPDNWDKTHHEAPGTPPPAASSAAPRTGGIPDNWDKTHFEDQPSPPPVTPAAGGLPDDWDKTQYGNESAAAPVGTNTGVFPDNPDATHRGDTTNAAPPPAAAVTPPATASPMAAHAPTPISESPFPGTTQQQPMLGDSQLLQQFLMSAGIDPTQVAPEHASYFMQVAGQILREVVHGMQDVLTARAQLKNEFRIATTTMKPVQNNPLKFSVDVDEAMMKLLIRGGEGYLQPVEAVKEGFDDIRAHQMAMLAGMRAAFDELLRRFEPEVLSARFVGGKGGLLKGKRNWDRYTQMMEQFARDPDASFRELFGDEFARAYEEQMNRLRGSHR